MKRWGDLGLRWDKQKSQEVESAKQRVNGGPEKGKVHGRASLLRGVDGVEDD